MIRPGSQQADLLWEVFETRNEMAFETKHIWQEASESYIEASSDIHQNMLPLTVLCRVQQCVAVIKFQLS